MAIYVILLSLCFTLDLIRLMVGIHGASAQVNCKRRMGRQIRSFIAQAFRQIASKLKVIEIAFFTVLHFHLRKGANKNVESFEAESLHRTTKKVDI